MRWLSFYSALQEYSSILACQGIAKQKDYFEHEGNPLQTDPRTEIYFRVRGNHISNVGNISWNSITKEKQINNDWPEKWNDCLKLRSQVYNRPMDARRQKIVILAGLFC